jgi:hypothetical protein
MHGNNTSSSCIEELSSSQTGKNAKFFSLSFMIFLQRNPENKREEQVLP